MKAHKAELTSFFAGLGPAVDIAKRAQAKLDRRAATQFSVFKYFKVQETDLSRIFGCLLDPTGKHGQGDRFLRLFLEEIRRSLGDTLRRGFPSSGFHKFKVHLEYPTDKGRQIDIVLEMPDDNHWIGIENKPRPSQHGELKDQVKDYWEDLREKVEQGGRGTAWILFLSGDGSDPTTGPDEEEGKRHCRTVSYRKTGRAAPSVENWIYRCWIECEAERVRWFLKDLLEYIQRKFELTDASSVQHGGGSDHDG